MLDLFSYVVKDENLHNDFKAIINDEEIKRVLYEWVDGFKDRDGKFVKEFQTTFNSAFWELYCFAVFKKLNLNINFNYSTPDFVLDKQKCKFNVECVIANNAKDKLEESDYFGKLYDNSSLEEKVHNQTLRILNSIHSKNEKYKKTYSKFNFVNENPFVLALAPFDQPRVMDVALEAIHMVLYGINYDKKNLRELKVLSVKKNKNIDLELGIFTNPTYENISAIMFSNVATIGKVRGMSNSSNCIFFQRRFNKYSNKSKICINYRLNNSNYLEKKEMLFWVKEFVKYANDSFDYRIFTKNNPFSSEGYKETLVDGLHIFINPFSKNKLNDEIINIFINAGIKVTTYDIENKEIIDLNKIDGYLIQRFVARFK